MFRDNGIGMIIVYDLKAYDLDLYIRNIKIAKEQIYNYKS